MKVLLRGIFNASPFISGLLSNSFTSSGRVGLDIVYAFFLIIPLVISASLGADFRSIAWGLASRFDNFPNWSDAKNSSLEPNDTCSVGRCRVSPLGGNSHLYKLSGSLWLSVANSVSSVPQLRILTFNSVSTRSYLDGNLLLCPPKICNIDQTLQKQHRLCSVHSPIPSTQMVRLSSRIYYAIEIFLSM